MYQMLVHYAVIFAYIVIFARDTEAVAESAVPPQALFYPKYKPSHFPTPPLICI
jgi:hypothetical protein